MPLIIRNQRIIEKESEQMAVKVEERLSEVANINGELQDNVKFQDDSLSPRPMVSTRRVARVIQPEIRKKSAPDSIVERIRKYIPAEIMVAWTMIKVGFEDAYDGPAETTAEIVTFSTVWVGFVAIVFLYVFESLRRERLVVALKEDLSVADMVAHASLSCFAFVLYSMTVGPPFSLWGVAEWVPMVGVALFTLLVTLIGDPYVSKPAAVRRLPEQQPLLQGNGNQ